MKQYGLISFFIVLLIITPQSDAANYQSQVDPTGANQYQLHITADTPQSFGTLLDVFRQQARDVCQGPYDILNINSPNAQSIIGAIACQSAAGLQQPLQQRPRQEQPAAPPQTRAPAPADSRPTTFQQEPLSPLQFGFGAGLNIPFEDVGDFLDITPSIHGTVLYKLRYNIALEGDVSWWLFNISDEGAPEENFDMSLIGVAGGGRYYLSPQLHVDAGLGLYRFSWEYDHEDMWLIDELHAEDDTTELGLYAGVGYAIGPFDLKARLLKSEFYIFDFWNIGVYAGYYF